ncbi:MAG: hypothetical protein WC216_08035, partial [Gallionella sp.]
MTEPKKIKPGRVDGKNCEYRSGSHRVPKHCSNEVEVLLQKNVDKAAKKQKKVGQGTQDKRRTIIRNFFSDLFYLKFKIASVYNLQQKHLKAVFN